MTAASFTLHLKRFRHLRTQLAVARSGIEIAPEVIDAARTELVAVETELAITRRGESRPDHQLATTLQLTADELDFVWAIVARAFDPLLLAQLQIVCGTDARRGLSLAHYATIMGLDDERGQTLAAVLHPAHPLRRYRFLIAPEDTHVDVCAPLTVPLRLGAYLQGDDEPEEAITAAGGRIIVPHDARLDDPQRASVQRIIRGLAGTDPVVIVLEGPTGAGRRTAVALAAGGRPVIAIDVSRISRAPGALEATLAAQLRECLIADAIPVVAEIDELIGGETDPRARLHVLARALETAPGHIVLIVAAAWTSRARGPRPARAPVFVAGAGDRGPPRAVGARTRR